MSGTTVGKKGLFPEIPTHNTDVFTLKKVCTQNREEKGCFLGYLQKGQKHLK